MSPRRRIGFANLLGAAVRAAAAALLFTALATPGINPVLAAPAEPAAPAAPATCSTVVTSATDSSLRAAVACAAASQTVTFSLPANSTISLTGGEIAIPHTMTNDGSGAPCVIVDAGNTSRVFNISASGPVTLTSLVLQHGHAAINGGAV